MWEYQYDIEYMKMIKNIFIIILLNLYSKIKIYNFGNNFRKTIVEKFID